ncbi:MAG: minor capsid protein [Gammaproteobacteria bacterium]|nr:minor capsid protein [Gammaproteobacteria bacterium]
MPEAVDLGFALRLPPRRAIEYFQSKGHAITWNWFDADEQAHAQAFTVAKVTRLDMLHTIRSGLQRALDQGRTGRDFAREIEPYLQSQGWWGRQIVVDAAGGAEVAQLGSPWRVQTIYRSNIMAAYNAGRYKQQWETRGTRPYWQYVAILDVRTRPSHAALHRKVFRADDPIWEHIYPPNGYNCRCRVRALSERDIERRRLTVESSEGHLRETLVDAGIDKRTGEVIQRPVTVWSGRDRLGHPAVFRTDPGWNRNPGREWARWDPHGALPDCIDGPEFAAGGGRCLRIGAGQPTWRDYGRPDIRDVPAAARHRAPALLPEAANAALALETVATAIGLTGEQRLIRTPIEQVAARRELLAHIVEKRADARERYAAFILPTLEQPWEVWLTAYADGYRRRYIALYEGAKDLMVVVRLNRDGSLMWNIMQTDDRRMNRQRIGALLFAQPQ